MGFDKWQLRDVAEIAKVSLATIYKHFPSRDDLIVATVERWMDEHVYKPIRGTCPGGAALRSSDANVQDDLRTLGEASDDA